MTLSRGFRNAFATFDEPLIFINPSEKQHATFEAETTPETASISP
jgi:hypothetical protein